MLILEAEKIFFSRHSHLMPDIPNMICITFLTTCMFGIFAPWRGHEVIIGTGSNTQIDVGINHLSGNADWTFESSSGVPKQTGAMCTFLGFEMWPSCCWMLFDHHGYHAEQGAASVVETSPNIQDDLCQIAWLLERTPAWTKQLFVCVALCVCGNCLNWNAKASLGWAKMFG